MWYGCCCYNYLYSTSGYGACEMQPLPPSERISFTLSNLQKHMPESAAVVATTEGSRRRTVPQITTDGTPDTRECSLAAAAGAATSSSSSSFGNVESGSFYDHKFSRPPPKLKNRRCCCIALIMTWTLLSTTFSVVTLLNLHDMNVFQTEGASLERRIARDDSIRDFVLFGVWDSRVSITPLQLQVAVSMALGVRASDDDVHVTADEESFFQVRVDHATIEEVEYIGSSGFFSRLNTHMSHYGGVGVLSRPPKLHRNSSLQTGASSAAAAAAAAAA